MPRWEALLALALIAAVLVLRFRRMAKERPLKPWRLRILPPELTLLLVLTLMAAPLPTGGYGALLVALALGATVGWHRGKLICIRHDEGEGTFVQQSSPMALLLLAGVIAGKFALKEVTGGAVLPDAGERANEGALVASSALLAFMIALVSTTNIEMALRCRQLAAGRGNGTGG